MSLDDRIRAFAGLVGLVLVLITLFTNLRATALRDLRSGPHGKREDAEQERRLNKTLLVFTMLLFAAGLPLVWDTVTNYHPRADSGPLRSAFVLSWLLLLGLMAWQISLVCDARELVSKLPPRNPGTSGATAPQSSPKRS
jgi:hypothetical protein